MSYPVSRWGGMNAWARPAKLHTFSLHCHARNINNHCEGSPCCAEYSSEYSILREIRFIKHALNKYLCRLFGGNSIGGWNGGLIERRQGLRERRAIIGG